MKKHLRLLGVVFSTVVLSQVLSSSASSARPPAAPCGQPGQRDRIVQIAPLERLANGGYDGTTTVADIKRTSDFGIGTFEGLDGEMIMLDGVVYHAPANGVLRVATPLEIIPFATLTRFRGEKHFLQPQTIPNYPALQGYLNSVMPDQSQILAIKVRGIFKSLKLRAPQKQEEPYPTLSEALKTQAIFELTNIAGTFVGFRFPPYVGTMNSAGYHFHFVSDNRSIGGHVLEASSSSVFVSVETVEQYDLTMGSTN